MARLYYSIFYLEAHSGFPTGSIQLSITDFCAVWDSLSSPLPLRIKLVSIMPLCRFQSNSEQQYGCIVTTESYLHNRTELVQIDR